MEHEHLIQRPSATLTKDAIARYRSEVEEQAEAVAARFDRLMEMEVGRLFEIAPPEPDSLLERAEAAIRQLKRLPRTRRTLVGRAPPRPIDTPDPVRLRAAPRRT